MIRPTPRSTLFPYTTLFRSSDAWANNLTPIVDSMRAVKDADEIMRLRRAVDISVAGHVAAMRSEEHTSELQSHSDLVCRLLLEKKKKKKKERQRHGREYDTQ